MEHKQKIVGILGPTASGKTALAIALARALSGEVISNDSMQVYKGMSIGTAAPTPEEMGEIPHHMIGVVSPAADFSCADYADMAAPIADEILSRGKLPVFCGGTGLYLDAVLYEAVAIEKGADALHQLLAAVDPPSAAAIHPNNVRRVIRALEIYETTGVPKSQFQGLTPDTEANYACTRVVLSFSSRPLLYERIDRRVEDMLASGLLKEVKTLYEAELLQGNTPAAQAIGYKEFLPYFAGECMLEEAVDAVRRNTRRYAKRQITWMRRYPDALVIQADTDGRMRPTEALVEEICERLA